ncbi:Glucose-induced degradation 4 [Chlorella sorokiniana]|uniref:Glucose-induced degradation 4 n=1 Tax=Chlorella sorokiniana TaxID=3076 RepID=A0A2P6TL45_CHLSO|nr:Glucose-induced degradation 4 [Chlorella sorokiniana]|eukprot:PRW45017.1 Glucose-induced degradation 4 [Chlorella sorokiniana]
MTQAAAANTASAADAPAASAAAAGAPALEPIGDRKLRILCLHGYLQNGEIFRSRIGSLRKALKSRAEFVFVDAPFPAEGDASAVAESGGDSSQQGRSWWQWSDLEPGTRPSRAAHYSGWPASQAAIRAALEEHAPIDGLLGFSQGATATALFLAHARLPEQQDGQEAPQAAEQQDAQEVQQPAEQQQAGSPGQPQQQQQQQGAQQRSPEDSLRFAVIIAGFLPRDATYADALHRGRPCVPSLHVFGAADALVPEERSAGLWGCFAPGSVETYQHPGAHMVPTCSGEFKQRMVQLLDDVKEGRLHHPAPQRQQQQRHAPAAVAAGVPSLSPEAEAARMVQRAALRLGRTLAATEALATEHGALPSLSPLDEELSQLLETIIGADPTSLAAMEAPVLARRAAAEARQRQHDQALLPPHRMPPSCAAAFPQPPDCAFLRPGQQFEGRQRVAASHLGPAKQEFWTVTACIQQYDRENGYICGTMCASDVPEAPSPVATFFEGEIIDNKNHSFYTADWDACTDTDFMHWSRLPGFSQLHTEVVRHGGRCPSLASHEYIYMRWKEQFFLQGNECRLSISGFYYMCVHRVTGEVSAFYFDPSSSPDQSLKLKARRERREPAMQSADGGGETQDAAATGGGAPAAAAAAAAAGGSQPAEAAAAAAGGSQPAEALPEAPHCLICTSPMAEVAIGACNHKEVCGQCTLRMRLCYGRHDCPLCKTELKEVIIAPWRPQLPDWEFYLAQPEYVARSAKWARGEVWADRWRRGGRLSSRLLHDLQRRTALACCVCDPGGESPFMRREQLLRHVQEAHDQRLCSLCLQEGRLFPLELEAFPSFEALQAHSSAAHPHCAFCRRTFYDDDALWKHMHQVHYSCHVCPPPMAAHSYFNRAPDLLAHMRQEHYLCEEPECADCFVAFESAEELRRHHLERHSARMPRWDPSRARTLQLDYSYTRRGGPAAASEGRRPRPRPQGPQDVRVLDGPDSAAAAAAAAAGDWSSEYAHEMDGGLRIIDDADFPSAAAAYAGSGGSGPGGPGGSLAAGGWAGRQRAAPRGQRGGDDFPSLAAAGGAEGGGGGREAALRPPPLVKKSAKCPCGRRVSHYAVQEGEEVPALECDAVCRLEGRKAQLADAFGVGDPTHHLSYWDTHRNATYSGVLLAAAAAQPKFIEGLERQLAAFVADKDSKRQSLSAMPREQRQVVHQLAEQYGLATTAYGQEPGRYIELFKTPSAGIPSRLLSRVAPTVPAEEVAALLRESEGHPMRLTDIALSADVRFYLRRWEGTYALEWQGGDAAVVRFEREQDLKDALDTLGGGIRGLFRVDRSWRPKTAVATVAPSSGGGGSRGWGGGEASGSRDARAAAGPAPAHLSLSGSRNLLSELTPELDDVHTSDDSDG